MATTAAAAKTPLEAPVAAPRKKGKLLLITTLVVVLLAAGSAAAWWFLHGTQGEQEEVAIDSKPPIFLPLEPFTVNLQPEEGQQFMQTAMTLKVSDQDVAEAVKAQMPQVRSRVLFLLSSKKPSQLGSLEGKNKLIGELIEEIEASLPLPKTKPKKVKKKARDDAPEAKSAKKAKAKAKAKDETETEEEAQPRRIVAVYFTHFIVQ